MRLVNEMQFSPSAVQMVGRLFGIVTTAPAIGAVPLTGKAAALALMTAVLTSAFAVSALAFALAAAAALAEDCFCSRSSFCSIRRSCCFNSAISASLLPDDCACAADAVTSPATATAAAVLIIIIRTPIL